MSTIAFTGFTPARRSLCWTQDGASCPPSRPLTSVKAYTPPSFMATACSSEGFKSATDCGATGCGSCSDAPVSAATSLAIPVIERPSGRFAVIAKSKTVSSKPRHDATALPGAGRLSSRSSKTAMPSTSVACPNSASEQIIPWLATPRSSPALIVRFTAGRTAPMVATGT